MVGFRERLAEKHVPWRYAVTNHMMLQTRMFGRIFVAYTMGLVACSLMSLAPRVVVK